MSSKKTMLCDDHMNSATGCCREGYIYDKYDILCGATYLPLTGAIGTIDPRREVDFFKFHAFADQDYTLTADSQYSRTDLYLYDSDGRTEIASADEIVWNCPISGTYYGMVYSRYSETDYTLSIAGPDFIPVDIDIKPGNDANCIHHNGKGVIPVAILGEPGFDARQIDPSTLRLNDMGVKSNPQRGLQAHIADVNDDGFKDMVVQFDDAIGAFQKDDTEAELLGQLFNGEFIKGVDTIYLIGNRSH